MWEKIEGLMKIDFESKPVYGDDDKYIKTKIKTYASSVITHFHNKKMPKEKAPCKCLSIIMIHLLRQIESITLKRFWKNVSMHKKR